MKKLLFSICIIFLIIYSCLYPQTIGNAAQKGLILWFQQILPTLLPFCILSSVLIDSKLLESIPGNPNTLSIITTMLCGFVFGFPIGAKLSADFYKAGYLTNKQAMILSIGTNNFSPMYVCNFAIPHLFTTSEITSKSLILKSYFLLYFLPLVISSILLLFDTKSTLKIHNLEQKKSSISNFRFNLKLFDNGILQGFTSLVKICGYIVFFSIFSAIIMSIFNTNHPVTKLLIQNIEMSNGIALLKNETISCNLKYVNAVQLLSLGGISGIMQSASILSDAQLSPIKYTKGKVCLSLLLSIICILLFIVFDINYR